MSLTTGDVNSGYPQPGQTTNTGTPNTVVIPVSIPQQSQQQPEVYTKEQLLEFVENARKEEKEKLYASLETLSGRVKVFEDERKAQEEAIAAKEAEAAEAERQRQQSELTVAERQQQLEQQWQDRFNEQEQRILAQQATFEKERQFQELNNYRTRRLSEMQSEIDPRFLDFVKGNTPEEIEAALFIAAEKTNEIHGEINELMGQQGQVQQQLQRSRSAMAPTTGPGFDPQQIAGATQQREVTVDEIRNMDMGDFAANREALLAAASNQVRERGLYGN